MSGLGGDLIQSFKMAPLVKSHELKNGFVQMENLDETTGLRFYLHNNKLADKPILLFP